MAVGRLSRALKDRFDLTMSPKELSAKPDLISIQVRFFYPHIFFFFFFFSLIFFFCFLLGGHKKKRKRRRIQTSPSRESDYLGKRSDGFLQNH